LDLLATSSNWFTTKSITHRSGIHDFLMWPMIQTSYPDNCGDCCLRPMTQWFHRRLEFDDDDKADKRRFDVFVRMLFSILVDADRLDSERFEQQHRLQREWQRPSLTLNPELLLNQLDAACRAKAVANSGSSTELNRLRDDVRAACRAHGRESKPGFFSLTVPTGGGKTCSSMAFALEHAASHGLGRVIVVIPYLSIIEQNAREYRSFFGASAVLEHHSAVEVPESKRRDDTDPDEPPHAIDVEHAIENWDAPIVVTTAVQFIETLFAASPARARKLHNVARSVVVFDEVQTMPTHLLEPTLDVLRTLQQHFGISVLFCSATQPAFLKSPNLKHGFRTGEVREIAPAPHSLFQKLQRVRYRVEPPESRWDWNRLADEMVSRDQPQALAVVNLRQHASDAFEALRQKLIQTGREEETDGVFHLSSAMCAEHRLALLYVARAEVRFRLTRSRRRRRLQIGRHQGKRLRLRLRVKHTVSHRARYKQAL
jgi:CRISPR-associated endonuclease/helicase Cas3